MVATRSMERKAAGHRGGDLRGRAMTAARRERAQIRLAQQGERQKTTLPPQRLTRKLLTRRNGDPA